LLISTKISYYFHIFAPAERSKITSMDEIRILDKTFRKLIPEKEIKRRIRELASQINTDLAGRDVLFIGVLNGSFIFAADIFRLIDFPAKISFIKLASYSGTDSSGTLNELIGWNEDVSGKTIIVIEDIVDTGNTIKQIVKDLLRRKAREVRIAALFFKPSSCIESIQIDYTGFEIPDDFVVGFGLDYNGYGRNLPSVYSLIS
jgi:hypoxanthine phosphoribosyltransferase